jgi:hypothetical protein
MNAASAVTPLATPVRRARAGWWRGLMGLALLTLALTVLGLLWLFGDASFAPVDVMVDGVPLVTGLDFAAWPAAHKLGLACVVALALLAALVSAVLALLVVAVVLVPMLLLSVGLPLLIGGVVMLALLSPLILLTWLLWRAVRPRPATIAA